MSAIGTGEETNAVLGLALLDIESDGHRAMVSRIQNELFDLGADLATPYVAGEAEGAALRITPAQSTRLETEMDERSEEHTSELQSLMRNSYAVFCLKKKNIKKHHTTRTTKKMEQDT